MAEEKKAPAKAEEKKTSKAASEREPGKLTLRGRGPDEPAAPSPPGFKKGMDWNSDDARRAYEAEGSSLEEQQRLGAEGEPAGSE